MSLGRVEEGPKRQVDLQLSSIINAAEGQKKADKLVDKLKDEMSHQNLYAPKGKLGNNHKVTVQEPKWYIKLWNAICNFFGCAPKVGDVDKGEQMVKLEEMAVPMTPRGQLLTRLESHASEEKKELDDEMNDIVSAFSGDNNSLPKIVAFLEKIDRLKSNERELLLQGVEKEFLEEVQPELTKVEKALEVLETSQAKQVDTLIQEVGLDVQKDATLDEKLRVLKEHIDSESEQLESKYKKANALYRAADQDFDDAIEAKKEPENQFKQATRELQKQEQKLTNLEQKQKEIQAYLQIQELKQARAELKEKRESLTKEIEQADIDLKRHRENREINDEIRFRDETKLAELREIKKVLVEQRDKTSPVFHLFDYRNILIELGKVEKDIEEFEAKQKRSMQELQGIEKEIIELEEEKENKKQQLIEVKEELDTNRLQIYAQERIVPRITESVQAISLKQIQSQIEKQRKVVKEAQEMKAKWNGRLEQAQAVFDEKQAKWREEEAKQREISNNKELNDELYRTLNSIQRERNQWKGDAELIQKVRTRSENKN